MPESNEDGLITLEGLCHWMNHHAPEWKDWFDDIAEAMEWHKATPPAIYTNGNQQIIKTANGTYKTQQNENAYNNG